VNETQPRVSKAKEEIITQEGESARVRNDAVGIEIECGGAS
jgi:hypothetical protein